MRPAPADVGHRWCPLTDFCMECGTSLQATIERGRGWRSEACPGGDNVTYLKARLNMEAIGDPVLRLFGLVKPQTRH